MNSISANHFNKRIYKYISPTTAVLAVKYFDCCRAVNLAYRMADTITVTVTVIDHHISALFCWKP